MTVKTAIGLMSGTSMDGIDAAILTSDGHRVETLGPALTLPYDSGFRARLRGVMGAPEGADIAGVARALTERHAEAVTRLLSETGMAAAEIDVIGFHGQTILHQPAQGQPGKGRTLQIGDGALLAGLTGIPVVNDFRKADVAAGGEGAPFAPAYHAALTAHLGRPVAMLNLGGVGNVTWIGGETDLLAFDTGPGNALIDDWVHRHTGAACDEDGRLAAQGKVDRVRIDTVLEGPYFQRRPPKSLDRDDFSATLADGLSLEDGAATLAALTVACVAKAADWFPQPPLRWIVTGGGRRNPVIMDGLRAALNAPVQATEELGWDGDALEAHAFAYLAVRSLAGLPLSFPGTTGVPHPLPGGVLHHP